jgi:CcmD family protein
LIKFRRASWRSRGAIRAFARIAIVLTAFVVLTPLVAAQEPARPPAAQDGFVPVRPGELEQEQLPAAPLVFVAYSVVWLALIFYVFLLWRRLATVERELREVAAKLQARRP